MKATASVQEQYRQVRARLRMMQYYEQDVLEYYFQWD